MKGVANLFGADLNKNETRSKRKKRAKRKAQKIARRKQRKS